MKSHGISLHTHYNSENTNVGEDTEKHTHSDVSGRNGIWDSHSGRWIGIIL